MPPIIDSRIIARSAEPSLITDGEFVHDIARPRGLGHADGKSEGQKRAQSERGFLLLNFMVFDMVNYRDLKRGLYHAAGRRGCFAANVKAASNNKSPRWHNTRSDLKFLECKNEPRTSASGPLAETQSL